MGIERILRIAAASLVVVATAGGALVGADEPSEKTVGGRGLKAVAKENRYALIIGVDYFPNLPTKEANERAVERGAERPSDDYALTSCANDAKNLAAALVEYAGFEADNVDALTFRKGDELEPSDPNVPTAANIRRKIAELTETLSEDDMLLVAFSGHGVAFGVKSNDDPVKRSYLCGCDADLSALSTFVDRKELLETLEKCRARRKIFLADCCRDAFELRTGGRFRGGGRSVAASANPFESGEYGFAQISACREGQRALETTDGGLFTSALIDGLRRGANEAGELSLTAWFEYAEKQTTARSRAILTTTPELGALDKAGRRQTVQSPTLYLIGETPRWIFADGLPVDGAALETWAKADALFDAARKIRERLQVGTSRPSDGAESERVAEWKAAKAKIAEALELTAEANESSVRRARYVAEEARLTIWATTEANKLAEAAASSFEKGDEASVRAAISAMKESLALVESTVNRRWLATFERKLDAPTSGTQDVGNDAPPSDGTQSVGWDDAPPAGTRKTLEIDGVEYAFRYCPAGTFSTGSPEDEVGRWNDETRREATTKGFWALETEVTQAMWESTTGENPSRFSPKGAGASQIGAEDASNFPVESVSWNACQNFIEKLNEKLDALGEVPVGFKLRLPTEAEWERACRAGSETAYCFGDDAERLKEYGNREGDDDGWARAAPVRSFKPNAWGLFDMHGNVAEWCADRYVRETDGAAAQTNAAQTAAGEGARVFRGGSWAQEAKFCRSAYRNFRAAASFGPFCGLRLALSR